MAKLGDFGLAVALDQTRHTQPGMMMGTVSYMAPEQAIGGQVDARSDLYALGCVLYEMVCGRPPFIGDESVAIITQHLNTPPGSAHLASTGLSAGTGRARSCACSRRSRVSDPRRQPRWWRPWPRSTYLTLGRRSISRTMKPVDSVKPPALPADLRRARSRAAPTPGRV